MTKIYFNKSFTFFILLLFCTSCTQVHIPSELLQRAETLMIEHPDSAFHILSEIGSGQLSGREYADWCLLYTQARDKNIIEHTSDSLIRHAVEYYERSDSKDKDRLMLSYYYMGRVNQDMQLAPRAQEYYLKALAAGKESTDYLTKGLISNSLGILYTYQYAYDLALPHLKDAYNYYEQLNDTEGVSYTLRDIARIYHQKLQLDSAQCYYEKALEMSIPNIYGEILRELSGVVLDNGDSKVALQYAQKSIQVITDSTELYPAFLVLGKVYLEIGQLDSAKHYLIKSLLSNLQMTIASANYNLLRIAEYQKDLEEGWRLLNNYTQLWNTIEKARNSEAIRQIEAMYNFQQVEQEAEEARFQKAIAERNLVLIIIIVLILLGIALFSYHIIKTKRKEERKRLREKLSQQEIIKKFKNKNSGKITNEDVLLLMQTIDDLFPDFKSRLSEYDLFINTRICYLCYLLKAKVKKNRIADLMSVSPQAITNQCTFLSKTIEKKNKPFKNIDEVIHCD